MDLIKDLDPEIGSDSLVMKGTASSALCKLASVPSPISPIVAIKSAAQQDARWVPVPVEQSNERGCFAAACTFD